MLFLGRNLILLDIYQAIEILAFVSPKILLTETLCNYVYLIHWIMHVLYPIINFWAEQSLTLKKADGHLVKKVALL